MKRKDEEALRNAPEVKDLGKPDVLGTVHSVDWFAKDESNKEGLSDKPSGPTA